MDDINAYLLNAIEDIEAAKALLDIFKMNNSNEGMLKRSCYFIQQACEKYLKYKLDMNGFKVPKTHNILELIQLCDSASISIDIDTCRSRSMIITKWNIESRYCVNILADIRTVESLIKELSVAITRLKIDSNNNTNNCTVSKSGFFTK